MARKATLSADAILASVAEHGGVRKAAAALGFPYSSFQLMAAKAKASQAPVAPSPTHVAVAPGLQLTPEMATVLQAMAAAFGVVQKPVTVAPAEKPRYRIPAGSRAIEPSSDLLRGIAAKREERAGRKKDEGRPVAGGTLEPPESRTIRLTGKRYILAAAQNNTYVHSGLMASLGHLRDSKHAEMLVSRLSYNKNGWGQAQNITKLDGDDEGNDEVWYDPAISEFVCDHSVRLAEDLIFCGELDILPTAVDPLSGFDSYTKDASAIIPHTKVAMKSLATMKHEAAKFLYTTGAVTQRNYIQRKAGQKAEFHHVFGALYVEIDDEGNWFARQLIADDTGSFQDLDVIYTPTGIRHSHVEAITWGDFHEEKSDPAVFAGCFSGRNSMLEVLRPRQQHVHDLADMRARNHHNLKDPHFMAQMHHSGLDRVEDDMARCASKLEAIERPLSDRCG